MENLIVFFIQMISVFIVLPLATYNLIKGNTTKALYIVLPFIIFSEIVISSSIILSAFILSFINVSNIYLESKVDILKILEINIDTVRYPFNKILNMFLFIIFCFFLRYIIQMPYLILN